MTKSTFILFRQFSSVQSLSRVRLFATPWISTPCPSPTPGVHSNSSPSSRWCHPAISSCVVPFFSCHQYLLASESFPMSQSLRMRWPKYWSFSFSIIPSKEHPGLISFRMTGWISLQSKGLSRVFSITTLQKHQFFNTQSSSWSNSYIHTLLLEKSHICLDRPLSAKWYLCFLMQSLVLL